MNKIANRRADRMFIGVMAGVVPQLECGGDDEWGLLQQAWPGRPKLGPRASNFWKLDERFVLGNHVYLFNFH